MKPTSHNPRQLKPTWVLLTASAGCAMTVLDTNVVAVVLPTIARNFNASFAEIEWVISTYVLCFASLLLPAGAIADRFGRQRIFLIGISAFAISSLLCGLATTAQELYLARAFQGVSAAFMLAPALAIIGHTFHNEADRNHAWSVWGAIMGLTMVMSPIIGGIIAYTLGWRWAFYINVPVCFMLACATLKLIEESSDDNARRLDPFGIIFFALTMFGLTWALINGQAQGWLSPIALYGATGGLISLFLFIITEKCQSRPMLDLGLFRSPRFIGGVWAMFAYAACAQVMASMLPLFLQNGMGKSALQAGFAMLPFALAMLVFPTVGRLLARKLSSREILSTGLTITGTGSLMISWGAQHSMWSIVMFGMLILGSGGGLLNGETQKAIMSTVPKERAGMASGISTTARFSGILLGFAVLSGLLATTVRSHLATAPCEGLNCGSNFAEAVISGDLTNILENMSNAEQLQFITQANMAYASGFAFALMISSIVAFLSAILVYTLMRKPKS